MSVTITRTPPAVALIGQPINFEFISSFMMDNDTVGGAAFSFLIDNDTFPGGKYVFYNHEARFEVNYVAGAQTLAEQLMAIPYVSSHYGVNTYESAAYSSFQIGYQSDNPIYEIIGFEHPEFVNFRDNNSRFPRRWSMFRFKVTTFLKNTDGSIKLLGEDYVTPNNIGVGSINIADYLRNETYSTLDLNSGDAIREQANMLADYYIKVEETSNDARFLAFDSAYKVPAESGVKKAMWGGLGYVKQGIFNQTGSDWYNDYLGKTLKPFLTNNFGEKTVSLPQRERLFYLNTDNIYLRLQCTLYYSDNTSATITVQNLSPTKALTVYALHVGYNELNLQANDLPGKDIVKYEVWLDRIGTQLTTKQVYVVDRKYYRETRWLYAVNSLGGWETIRLNQAITDSSAFERIVNNYVVEDNYNLQTLAVRTQTKRTDSTEASSGWISNQTKLLMRELLMSRKVFEDVGQGIPVIVNFDTTEIANQNKEYLKTETLSYTRAFDEAWYSDEAGTVDMPDRIFDNYFSIYFA